MSLSVTDLDLIKNFACSLTQYNLPKQVVWKPHKSQQTASAVLFPFFFLVGEGELQTCNLNLISFFWESLTIGIEFG